MELPTPTQVPQARLSALVLRNTGLRVGALALMTALSVSLGCSRSDDAEPGTSTPPSAGSQAQKHRTEPTKARSSEPTEVRPAFHAGAWYPADPEVLRREIEQRVASARRSEAHGPVLALIGPHAGLRYSGFVAARAYADIAGQDVRRVFLLGPSHYAAFGGVALPAPDLRAYATPLGELPIDREAVERLREEPGFQGPARAHDPEHSLEMHAIFLAARFPGVEIVPLLVGRVADSKTAVSLAGAVRALLGPGDLVVVSSDFTHYGPRYNYAPYFDRVPDGLHQLADAAARPLLSVDLQSFTRHLEATDDTICGREPLRILLALLASLPADAVHGREVARDTSGRITGDFANSVTYLGMVYRGKGWSAASEGRKPKSETGRFDVETERLALALARQTLETYLGSGRIPADTDLRVPAHGAFRETRAAFVTLKRGGRLRGCIGHIVPVQPLWCDIRDNAIAAAVRDPRFPPVTAAELPDLEVEVSVLSAPRPIPGPEAFEVGRHGIVLQAMGRRAVFLPQVAPEQGWDRETALSQLARKAGLYPLAWQHPQARFQVFEAQVFCEPTHRL